MTKHLLNLQRYFFDILYGMRFSWAMAQAVEFYDLWITHMDRSDLNYFLSDLTQFILFYVKKIILDII